MVRSPAFWIGVVLIVSAPVFVVGWVMFGGPSDGGAYCMGSSDCSGVRLLIGLAGAGVLCVLGAPLVLLGAGLAERRRRREFRAPPGWYRDPSDKTGHRFWDGAAWTEHTQS